MQALAQYQLNIVLSAFVNECKALFGDKLYDIMLFGSYARGDYDDESDVDIMIILDMSKEETNQFLDGICRIASDLSLEHNAHITPVIQSKEKYELHKQTYGFYRNIEMEGVHKYIG